MPRQNRTRTKRHSATFNLLLILLILVIIGIIVFGYFQGWFDWLIKGNNTTPEQTVVSGELSIHYMELGNDDPGDSIFIKAGDTDILVDGGSNYDSVNAIQSYVNQYCTDGVLEYVIVTHYDLDHIACFAGSSKYQSLFDLYQVELIIDAPLTNKTTNAYNNYVAKRTAEIQQGATHYNALQCYNNQDGAKRTYQLSEGVELEILYQKYYEETLPKPEENDYSVCFMINQGSRHFLFTGDLEANGEQSLVESNDLPEVDVFKAGHHGSKGSTNEVLLSVIRPKIVVIPCVASNDDKVAYGFPRQETINRIAVYTDKVYITSMIDSNAEDGFSSYNGTVRIISSADKDIQVDCTNNNTLLKDSQWFIDNRIMPEQWKAV